MLRLHLVILLYLAPHLMTPYKLVLMVLRPLVLISHRQQLVFLPTHRIMLLIIKHMEPGDLMVMQQELLLR